MDKKWPNIHFFAQLKKTLRKPLKKWWEKKTWKEVKEEEGNGAVSCSQEEPKYKLLKNNESSK